MHKFFKALPCLLICHSLAVAQVRLPQLISDGMVLQRNKPINLWGWAQTGEKVTLKFAGKTYRTITGTDGKWTIQAKALKAGGPYTLTINASNHITLNDILIGDVWFCSGQSNMALLVSRVKERFPDEIKSADYPQIRNFFIPTVSDVSKIYDDLPPGKWLAATPQQVLSFGATSWFFAKKIYQKYRVPIGIINSSVGGTPAQAWISDDGIKQIPAYASRLEQLHNTRYLDSIKSIKPPENPNPVTSKTDEGLNGALPWFDVNYKPENWKPFWLPGYWADQGIRNLNGIVWFRKEVDIPAELAQKPATLFVGRIIDADETYINGKKVGNITYQYPPRIYPLPQDKKLLHAGKNVITVRVINYSGKGGFVPDKTYALAFGKDTIDLRGNWQYKVGQAFTPAYSNYKPFSAQDEPTGLYNTMVAPAINYGIKGFVWYQGETNAGKPQEYDLLLKTLITNWRSKWKDDKLPFIYAQLPNFMEEQYLPSSSQWAEMREAQAKALSMPATGMAVTIDAGEWNDIHPLDKKTVGERLAIAAEKVAYGEQKIVSSGPILLSSKINDREIILTFSNTGSGLVAKGGGKLRYFAIAGDDKRFIWADARIEGNTVIVSNDKIIQPKFVRYAWADNPDGANLYNIEGLPASPFRTDGL
ncbi:sialate O-acetylesterase [Mucilaginibacter terrae]|uniref:Sialate O-acetylesterase n=1 Tax=Mucilaginibacter terrae TaxID=1955052 RepID=A0ABU3GR36_9SPHI|nr:sialate O-acetylesterase [Mucilaginibacter terrae]MDT3402226.1 sialate O-acetylesterase [Mucilaginibacter terrae]